MDYRGGPVLADGEVEHRLTLGRLDWDAGEREDAYTVTPSARFGLAAGYDVALAAPLRRENGDQELRGLRLEAGVPLTPRGTGTDVTLVVHGQVLPADPPLASGSDGLGAAVHLSDRLGTYGTRLDGVLGVERTDVAFRDAPGYEAVNRVYYANRVEQPITERVALSAEAHTTLGLSGEEQQNQFAFTLRPGVRYDVTGTVSLRATAGRDIADRGVEPQNTIHLSLVHRPAPPPRREELMARVQRLEHETQRLREDQALDAGRYDENRERLRLLQQRVEQLDVEVINPTGDRGRSNRTLDELEDLGHYVVRRTERASDAPREVTHIEYRAPRHKASAWEIAERLSMVPIVVENPDLPRGVHARVVIGTDLAQAQDPEEDDE